MRLLPKRKEIKAESPIEEIMIRELRLYGLNPAVQFQVGQYRADIAFPDRMLVIECDGKEWHSSDEQIARDKKRDEYFRENGWSVIRISGRDIYRQADEVVKAIVQNKVMPDRTIKYKEFLTEDKMELMRSDFPELVEANQKEQEEQITEYEYESYASLNDRWFYSTKDILQERYKKLNL